MNITTFMAKDHKDCDHAFAEFENHLHENNWEQGTEFWNLFVKKLLAHFQAEEEVLFPAFEDATGMVDGPTSMMRLEHQQMREMVEQIKTSLAKQSADDCLGIADTLMLMLQQHNMKEEQVLYPMADQQVDAKKIIQSMSDYF